MQPTYGFGTTLPGTNIEQARPRVEAALKQQGFGVLTVIDLAATLAAKIGATDHAPHIILGACNPSLADRALRKDPSIGLLLPCNVTLRQVGDDIQVSVIDPKVMFQVMPGGDLSDVAQEAETRLRAAIATLNA